MQCSGGLHAGLSCWGRRARPSLQHNAVIPWAPRRPPLYRHAHLYSTSATALAAEHKTRGRPSPTGGSAALRSARVELRKRFGQHLLKNADVVKNIVDKAHIQPHETVFEIGPGTGNLTVHLLQKALVVYAVELDQRLYSVLKSRVEQVGLSSKLQVVLGDFLQVPLPHFDALVANIPYQISSPVLRRLFEHRPLPSRAIIMFQREFADRLVAQPGTSAYCRLSVNTQLLSLSVRIVMKIGREQFRPPPKVDSAVVEIVPNPKGPPPWLRSFRDWDAFLRLCFSGGKNKTLRSIFANKNVVSLLLSLRQRRPGPSIQLVLPQLDSRASADGGTQPTMAAADPHLEEVPSVGASPLLGVDFGDELEERGRGSAPLSSASARLFGGSASAARDHSHQLESLLLEQAGEGGDHPDFPQSEEHLPPSARMVSTACGDIPAADLALERARILATLEAVGAAIAAANPASAGSTVASSKVPLATLRPNATPIATFLALYRGFMEAGFRFDAGTPLPAAVREYSVPLPISKEGIQEDVAATAAALPLAQTAVVDAAASSTVHV